VKEINLKRAEAASQTVFSEGVSLQMKSVSLHVSERGHAQFWALMALIVYTPLPLASNRPWALALLGVLTGCMLLWSIWRPGGHAADSVWRSAKVPLLLLELWMLLVGSAARSAAGLMDGM